MEAHEVKKRVGFMQGRLVFPEDGRIQSFPEKNWRDEFALGERNGFSLMEWVFEAGDYARNPVWTGEGVGQIQGLMKQHRLEVDSLVADIFMENFLVKGSEEGRGKSLSILLNLIEQCAKLRISKLEIPFVDSSSLGSKEEESELVEVLKKVLPVASKSGVVICLETDLSPKRFKALLETPGMDEVLANFDMGNSASLGYDPEEEIAALGSRIGNVHVKDRVLGGSTVPLGEGNVDFPRVFKSLDMAGYQGNFILQTARNPGKDVEAACRFRDQVCAWIRQASEGNNVSS